MTALRSQLAHWAPSTGACGVCTNWRVDSAGAQRQTSMIGFVMSEPIDSARLWCEGSTCRYTAFHPAFSAIVCVTHWAEAQ